MLLYIIKFSACLAILLLFYKLFLERERMHVFKRFYLLGALVFSLLVPQLVFSEFVVVEHTPDAHVQPMTQSTGSINIPPALEADVLDIAPLLWGVYFIGLIFFGIHFIKNLLQVVQRIKNNHKEKKASFVRVLLHEDFPPHTFFNYIFLNKVKLQSKEIPKEVLLHEETHARQKHSLDVLFIEVLQVLFWFNPLIYLIRKSIKLNHEFLADSSVLQKGVAPSTYQNTLLSFMTPNHQTSLANAINYSSIKKRFTVMKKRTSKKSIALRTLFLLPLLAIMLYGFSEQRIIEIPSTIETINTPVVQKTNPEQIEILLTPKGLIYIQNNRVAIEELPFFLLKYNRDLTKEQRSNKVRAIIRSEIESPSGILEDIEAILIDYGIAQVDIMGPEYYSKTTEQTGATNAQIKTYNSLAKQYNAISMEKRKIPLSDLKILETVYRKMNVDQREKSQPFPECPPQEGATKKQIKEYNTLAKKYNRELSEAKNILIKKSEVERLEYLHGIMTHKQKENAEPFPDFPEPPPAPKAPKQPKAPKAPKVNKGEKSDIPPPPAPPSQPDLNEVEEAGKVIDEIIAHQDPYDNLNTMNLSPSSKKIFIDMPPTPPTPISPLDHAIEMAKQGAVFYYGKKKITSDEAIDLLKTNSNLSMDISKKNNNPPVVKISRFLD